MNTDEQPPQPEPEAMGGANGPAHDPPARLVMPAPPAPPKRTGVFLDATDLRDHVGALLRTFLPGYEVDQYGNFTFQHDGARVFVTVGASPIGPQIGVFSITNVGVPLDDALAGFLLSHNHRFAFGAFSYDPDNQAVWLRHTLLGTMIDGPELQAAVAAIATTAAEIDGTIKDRFGGRTFSEAPDDVQEAARPVEEEINASGYL
ncbi:MAG: type III secretion system chaperone [Nitriliruptorales bacterium]|nr:type III secretion system chaperone [Nitriliruptorales bacterium]